MKIRWLRDNQARTSAYPADRGRLQERVCPLRLETLRFESQMGVMQDELGIARAEGRKLWKLEIRRNFTAYRNLFQEMPQSLVMQPYPDIVNTIICFFLWAHASNHLIFAWMWVCVRGGERERGRRFPVPPLLSVGTFGGTQICDFISTQFRTNICACS